MDVPSAQPGTSTLPSGATRQARPPKRALTPRDAVRLNTQSLRIRTLLTLTVSTLRPYEWTRSTSVRQGRRRRQRDDLSVLDVQHALAAQLEQVSGDRGSDALRPCSAPGGKNLGLDVLSLGADLPDHREV